ncbi:hypothetical protein [Candidatus Nitrospira allomarina]|uniref:Secreted protein n=1 Tax=Candidatus Nitrospira allomarina TaxID=3020900 RepID=A0AA96JTH2_9BACT|nr:hypothetical protein [Candidatus Nitrospira allomarina]WNM59205.1 hypothetical protein PP769_05415 [Candidatus Nitrospira allomarina]
MKRISHLFVVVLVFCLLTLSGILAAQAVEHSQHHSQHHQGTHSTLLCTWFCAAGQTLETKQVLVDGPVESFLQIGDWRPITHQVIFVIPPASRAPPSSL